MIKFLKKNKKYDNRNIGELSNPIIVAGLGRCGTTLVFDAIKKMNQVKKFEFIVSLDSFSNYENNTLYKTHSYPPRSLNDNIKVIFMFGDIADIIRSTHNKINEWGLLHHKHLGSSRYSYNNSILEGDTLGLYDQFISWMKPH